jgi:hypothetical protein
VLANADQPEVQGKVRQHVKAGAKLLTAAHPPYFGLGADYIHRVIDHAECYAKGRIHTNGLENFRSPLERGLNGTYISVELFHLFRYLDEQAFRYNRRKDASGEPLNDGERFQALIRRILGKRLTYEQLTGKTAAEATTWVN